MQVSPATLSDCAELATLTRLAFAQGSALSQAMFANVDPKLSDARFAARLAKNIAQGEKHGKAVFKAVLEGKIVGLGDWDLPKEGDVVELPEEAPEPWLPGTNEQVANEFFGIMAGLDKAITVPHYRSLPLSNSESRKSLS